MPHWFADNSLSIRYTPGKRSGATLKPEPHENQGVGAGLAPDVPSSPPFEGLFTARGLAA
jgi:hypothetical protein